MGSLLIRIGRWLLMLLAGTIGLLCVFLVIVALNSPGKEQSFKDKNNQIIPESLAEVQDKIINEVAQRLVIRSKDTLNPVLLVIHGGPGGFHNPFLNEHLGISVEDLFTVCYWDQRGSGPAYTEQTPDSTMTLNQIVDDGIVVSNYLRQRFSKEKIYIEGQSWGTVVGAFMAKKAPELFHAYVGLGQVTNQMQSEILSYNYVLSEAVKKGDSVAIKELKGIGIPPYGSPEEMIYALDVERYYLQTYSKPFPISRLDYFKLFFFNKAQTMQEKLSFFFGDMSHSFQVLWPSASDMNLFRDIPEWKIPVFILHGDSDHYTETSLARSYFDSIIAPSKKYYSFENTGHIVSWERPQKYRCIMENEVLKGL